MLLLSGSELLSLPAASSASALPNRAGTPLRMMAIAGVERRRVPVSLGGDPPLMLHVDEVADWSWWDRESEAPGSNPYGAKLWPAALAIAEHLAALPASALQDLSVLELGCGNGLCSMAAAARGASRVVASDLSADALQLTREAVARQKLSVDTLQLDLGDRSTPLPPADLVIAADLLYDDTLAAHVATRVAEAIQRGSWVIVGDARRAGREAFMQKLREVSAGTPPCFGPSTSVRLKAVGWKQKHVDLMHVNTPSCLTDAQDDLQG